MRSATSSPDSTLAWKPPLLKRRRKCQGETRIITLDMISSSQIKEHLALYLEKQISLEQLENWFVPNSRDIRRSQSEAAKVVTFAVEGALAEYLSGIYSEHELRNELSQVVSADTKVVIFRDAMAYEPVLSWVTSSQTPIPAFARP
jgi:hypothetical protein